MIKPNFDLVTQILEEDEQVDYWYLSKRELAELFLGVQGWMVYTKRAFLTSNMEREQWQYQVDTLKQSVKDTIVQLFMSEMDR